MIIKKLKGHSGCEVFIIKNNQLFVRKISPNLLYNSRLIKQMKKQSSFKHNIIKTPKILNTGFIDGKYFFDMEYIHGCNLSQYIEKESVSNIKNKFKVILNFLINNNEIDENIEEQLKTKIASLNIGNKYDNYKNYCLNFNWTNIKKSYCHGDLTFENVIISGKNIYFIDFLDSFVDSRIIDYSKIYQDLFCSWSNRKSSSCFNIKHMIMDEMINLIDIEKQACHRMLVLNLLRIIPYSDVKTLNFIESKLRILLENNEK